MASSIKTIELNGIFASGVLGTFRIIRGFAPLRELAVISAPFEMATGAGGPSAVTGYQRAIDDRHAREIREYLERGKLRFIPEVILSIRMDVEEVRGAGEHVTGIRSLAQSPIEIRPRRKNQAEHLVRIPRAKAADLAATQKIIRRLDGNHRLHLAETLQEDSALPTKYLAPFCLVVLGPTSGAYDDHNEAMLFHIMNTTACPLDSEHALEVLLGQPAQFRDTSSEELATSPPLYLTRVLKEKLDALPTPQRERLGSTPATVLYNAAEAMLALDSSIKSSVGAANSFADDYQAALLDILPRLPVDAPDLLRAKYFVELVSLVWRETAPGSHDDRVATAANRLGRLARWLGEGGLEALEDGSSIGRQVLDLFSAIERRVPRRVFLARWYPTEADGDEFRRGNHRKDQIDRTIADLVTEGIELELDDPGSQTGPTFPIHQDLFRAIDRNDIILVDLSGVRPNVCIEAGYALRHAQDRLVFLFQRTEATSANPAHASPPFDLQTFRYESIDDAADIPSKLRPHLKKIVEDARLGL